MESRFGYDFGGVRIHTDGRAVASAQALRAQAYTLGWHIVFGREQPPTASPQGRRLLAHELTHVAQQGRGLAPTTIQRLVDPQRVSCQSYPRTYPIFTAIGTDDPVGVLQTAATRAIQMLDNVIGELTHIRDRVSAGDPPAPPLISDAVAQGLRSRLRLDPTDLAVWTGTGARTIEQLIRWYTNIRSFLTSGAIRYTCLASGCEGGDFAYTEEGAPRRIHLCRPFWTSSEDEQALTLIHETAHLYYGLEDTGRGAGNVGCLEEFVSVVNAVTIPAFVVCPPSPTP